MGLGLGLCCCGCATCGGIIPDVVTTFPVACVFDYQPTTTDYETHNQNVYTQLLTYESLYSTPTVQVFTGTIGTVWRLVLRLEDNVAPTISMTRTLGVGGSAPPMSADLIGSLGGLAGAVWQCTADGWVQIEHFNSGGLFYQLAVMEGVYLSSGPSSNLPPQAMPIPNSWCCPNGNGAANGGGNCDEADTLPASATLTIAGWSDRTNKPWSALNGTFVLAKTAESSNANAVTASYLSDLQTYGTCEWRWSATISAPRPGKGGLCASFVASQLVALGGCGINTPFYGLASSAHGSPVWRWMQLGCTFGWTNRITSPALAAVAPTQGRPTLLAW